MSDTLGLEREVRALKHLLTAVAKDVKAIRRAVDPDYSGEEAEKPTRKKDPRALYSGH